MDLFEAYHALNKSVIGVLEDLNRLEPVKDEVKVPSLRVEEVPMILTEESAITGSVITAHNLSQYQNNFYKLNIEEDVSTALDDLLKIDEEQVEEK